MNIENVEDGREALARQILERLPEWFGRKHALESYISKAGTLPMFAVFDANANAIGFLSLKQHSNVAVEAYVLGVLPEKHRQGIGRSLFAYAERCLIADGIRYLTVKTLAATDSNPRYANTRRFYQAIGFDSLEIFPTLWDSTAPCLFMVKRLESLGRVGRLTTVV